ncbi:hypothetical protein CTAYLR_002015 [Chrysophaeum taylorii]|uniref:Uncharacterized protein n=1 Tax=Chrysophaeum taylorii TaxID=2483200 RepID=A0AAD7XJ90_9STRA|nr:hypothetical protein CTAYLR_002015 [Chrysophaeum taylorii]
MLRVACLFGAVATVGATVGVDVSSYVSESEWECLMTPGGQGPIEFAIVRIYRSSGSVDPNGASTISAAISAGVSTVDGYIFPCVSCGDAAGQVSAAIRAMSGTGSNMLWLDIENYDWYSSASENQAFITDMVDECMSEADLSCGIYSSYYNWEDIVGLSFDYPSSKGLPLWYAHYDNNPSFSDFTAFGGWTSPTIKQYVGDATSCDASIDYNYATSLSFRNITEGPSKIMKKNTKAGTASE